jgi:hypothetical protein
MPVFRGVKNVLIQPAGAEKAVVAAVYDHATREYVITLDKNAAKKHRDALLAEGLREIDDAPVAAAASDTDD